MFGCVSVLREGFTKKYHLLMVMRGGGTNNTPPKNIFFAFLDVSDNIKILKKLGMERYVGPPHAYGNSIVYFLDFYLYPSLNKH